jgi:hypothetical protein
MNPTVVGLLAAGLLAALLQAGPAKLPASVDLIPLDERPSATDLACASSMAVRPEDWTVGLQQARLAVTKVPPRRGYRRDPLPFPVDAGDDRNGERRVLKVPGGWLVGFDQGEFGGALWFTTGATDWRRLEPTRQEARAQGLDAPPQNVREIVETPTGIYVLTGLDQLKRHGRVSRATRAGDSWHLEPVAKLDASPVAALWHDGALDVVTGSGLWRVSPSDAKLVAPIAFGTAFPNSLVVEGKRRWLGLRRYVVALDESPTGWTERWFGPRVCVHPTQNPETYECRCQG